MLSHLGSGGTAAAYSTTITGGRRSACSVVLRAVSARVLLGSALALAETVAPLGLSCPRVPPKRCRSLAIPILVTSATRLLGSEVAVRGSIQATTFSPGSITPIVQRGQHASWAPVVGLWWKMRPSGLRSCTQSSLASDEGFPSNGWAGLEAALPAWHP